jgi:mono/diheme cytochrome c family protein
MQALPSSSREKTRATGPAKGLSFLATIVTVGGVCVGVSAWAQDPAPPTGLATYTAEQADRGHDIYNDKCAACHMSNLLGEAEAPALIGLGVRNRYFVATTTAARFFTFISTNMPAGAAGTLEPQEYADIMAYILQRNDFAAGEAELPADPEILATLTFPE